MFLRLLTVILSAVILQACGPRGEEAPRPETAAEAAGEAAMVAAAHPLAVEAGLEALRAGGDAVDAAIAVQMVLGLVEPQSSGIAGGAFMVRYDAASGEITVYDGRETAPASVTESLWLDGDGAPLGFVEAWQSGRSTGIPGLVAMLAMAHDAHGRLEWADGFTEAIRIASEGFEVSPRLSALAERIAPVSRLAEREPSRSYFYDPDGEAWPAGHVLTNPAYAATLTAVAADWRNFYTGGIARQIIGTAGEEPHPGAITEADLAGYEPVRREALCSPYRAYVVCSAPPPSSGGVALGMILTILEGYDMSAHGPDTAEGWRLFIEASRLAYADRDRYVGDADFADVPVEGLLDRDYLAARRALIRPDQAIEQITHGAPPGAPDAAADTTPDNPGTSHFSIRDRYGNVVSMTTTIESGFGNNRMTEGGFLLNNQLTDFAFIPADADGRGHPNAPAPGKRPRSSMSPAIVFGPDGRFVLATGSPGGNSIIAYTAKTLVAMLDWGLTAQEAAELPNVVARGDVVNVEEGFDETVLESLREAGYEIRDGRGENSGVHIIHLLEDGTLAGGADPRRDGAARQP